ncbi:polysulfide reductase NrfD [bacterium]|nr:polysulfide reductase NrfD [bacterium]
MDRTRRIKDILWLLTFFGIVAMVFRFYYGLGATTNLTDNLPWGVWKILNMVAGAALATSGFTVGFMVYVLKLEKYRPLLKPVVLVAFLGYGSSLFALLFDIGLPYRFWHPFVMWNEHSFLFEVFWCVSFYFLVTFLELTPTVLERFGLKKVQHFLHKLSPGIVIFGITLSSMHHTSLGSLFLVTPQRLHPLWYSPRIPLLFILSAIGGGLLMFIAIKMFYDYLQCSRKPGYTCSSVNGNPIKKSDSDQKEDFLRLRGLATIAAWVLGIYLCIKIIDLFWTGAFSSLFSWTWESFLYLSELLFATMLPIFLLIHPRTRKTQSGLAVAAVSGAFGLALNRLNVGIFGYFRDAGAIYFPSLAEWAISLGVISMAGLAFFFLAENFSIFDERWKTRHSQPLQLSIGFDKLSMVWKSVLLSGVDRVSLMAIFIIPIAWWTMYPPFQPDSSLPIHPPKALDAERHVLLIDGNQDGVATTFAHFEHQERLGGKESCVKCHHLTVPGDHATPCSRCHIYMSEETNIFDHTYHLKAVAKAEELTGIHPENNSCNSCHAPDVARSGTTAKNCLQCHDEDMHPVDAPEERLALMTATGYMHAMHKNCINCHREKAEEVQNNELGDCITCHRKQPGSIKFPTLLAKNHLHLN